MTALAGSDRLGATEVCGLCGMSAATLGSTATATSAGTTGAKSGFTPTPLSDGEETHAKELLTLCQRAPKELYDRDVGHVMLLGRLAMHDVICTPTAVLSGCGQRWALRPTARALHPRRRWPLLAPRTPAVSPMKWCPRGAVPTVPRPAPAQIQAHRRP